MNSGSTPRKARIPVNTTNLDTTRDALINEVGGITIYKLADLVGHILPGVSDSEISGVRIQLNIDQNDPRKWVRAKLMCMDDKNDIPSKLKLKEEKIYAGIPKIFNAVAEAVKKLGIGKPVIKLVDQPRVSPSRKDAAHKTRPDATYILLERLVKSGRLSSVDNWSYRANLSDCSWADSAGADEYKLVSNDENVQDVRISDSRLTFGLKYSSRMPKRSSTV